VACKDPHITHSTLLYCSCVSLLVLFTLRTVNNRRRFIIMTSSVSAKKLINEKRNMRLDPINTVVYSMVSLLSLKVKKEMPVNNTKCVLSESNIVLSSTWEI
jgi:hypothetical protein